MANSLISNAFHQISRELRLPAIIWFPRSSICKMDLLAVRTIPFLHGNVVTRLRVSPCWHRNGLARSDSVLAYGHRAWPASIRLAYGQRGLPPYWHRTDVRTDNWRDKMKHNAPLQALLHKNKPVVGKARWYVLSAYSIFWRTRTYMYANVFYFSLRKQE